MSVRTRRQRASRSDEEPLFELRSIARYPALSARACGWLRFLHRKAHVDDDWGKGGKPSPLWDRWSTPPMMAFPRFDLLDSSYAVALMADVTPAWREVYGAILDRLVARHTTWWACIDWLTMLGEDPARKNYPEWYRHLIPRDRWGEYDAPGWTANGVQPWGLQWDPIAADGALFIKGFFNLLLGLHLYVSGDHKWNQPFEMIREGELRFTWTHNGINQQLARQWAARPEGPHCENTKVWPF
jgi:hypothetical protein